MNVVFNFILIPDLKKTVVQLWNTVLVMFLFMWMLVTLFSTVFIVSRKLTEAWIVKHFWIVTPCLIDSSVCVIDQTFAVWQVGIYCIESCQSLTTSTEHQCDRLVDPPSRSVTILVGPDRQTNRNFQPCCELVFCELTALAHCDLKVMSLIYLTVWDSCELTVSIVLAHTLPGLDQHRYNYSSWCHCIF